MKRVFTQFVEDLSDDTVKLRQEIINIMMVEDLHMIAIAHQSGVGYTTVLSFIKGTLERPMRQRTKMKLAAWVESKLNEE